MAPTEKRFNSIDGTPVYYFRWTDGTAGRNPRQLTFACTNAFYSRLVAWIRDLRKLSAAGGLTGLNRIVTAGAYVNKPGQHGMGQAIDVDEVRWGNWTISPYARHHAHSNIAAVRRYLALDAVCRRHFRWVLDAGYNAAHQDHLHLDFGGGAVRLAKSSRSDTAFVQMACNAHMGSGLKVDGVWGAKTQSAFELSRRRLNIGGDPFNNTGHYQAWLGEVARCGFRNRPFEPRPAPPPPPPKKDPLVELVEDLLEDPLGTLLRDL